MFGGYFALIKAAETGARGFNRLREAYEKLQAINPDHPLLEYVSIRYNPEQKSPFPEICPVMFSIIPNEQMRDYKLERDDTLNNMLSGFPSVFVNYTNDLEKAINES